MEDNIKPLLLQAEQRLREQEAKVIETKKFINQLLGFAGLAPRYPDSEFGETKLSLQGDEFHGKKQSTACRMALERRKNLGLGPASLADLHSDLLAGGYVFTAKSEEIAQRGMQQMMTQNSLIFRRLPNGLFGLRSWYGDRDVPRRKAIKDTADGESERDSPEEDQGTEQPEEQA